MMSSTAPDDLVKRRCNTSRSRKLLKRGFGVLGRAALDRKFGLPQFENEAACNLETAIEEQGSNQGFDDVADHILALRRTALARLSSKLDQRRHPDLMAILGAGLTIDEAIEPLRQMAFGLGWISFVKR